MLLVIFDGPAEGQRIETSVDPSWTRWFCELLHESEVVESWWVIDHNPPEDPDVRVTRYDVDGARPDEEHERVYYFTVKEENGVLA